MSNKMNGYLMTKIILSVLIGISAASLVAGFLGRFLQQTGVKADFVLLIGICALMVVLIIQTIRKTKRFSAQKGGMDFSDNILEGIAIVLLLFTSLLSGQYLLLVPVVSISLIVIYVIIRIRRGKSNSQD